MNTTEPHAKGEHGEPPAGKPAGKPAPNAAYYLRRGLKALASLQVTVVLFAFAIGLVFFGTLAQIDFGIWTVVDKYFASLVVEVPFDLIRKFLSVFWKESFPPGGPDVEWKGTFPFPGGYLIGGAMAVNLLAAHATRFRFTWKRSGIFFIHGGILCLGAGEVITREFAIEQQMRIDEGGSANFTLDTRNVELAFVTESSSTEDRVTVVAQKRLQGARRGQRITHPDLPADIEVVKFLKNSDLTKPKPGVENLATAGAGREMLVEEVNEESGVALKQRGDIASAYVKLFKKGTDDSLGVYLVSLFVKDQTIELGGKSYQISLRHTHHYKPYRVHLDKFRFDRYEGTQKPRNYSSDVRVDDENGNEVRKQRIKMNEPMRYAGETFYQSSFDKAETTTILQVVKNPGSLNFGLFHASIDYIACALVGFGLILHFSIALIPFLLRRQAGRTAAIPIAPPVAPGAPAASRIFPWVMLGIAALGLLSVTARMTPRAHKEPYDMDSFARLPVIEGGRVKPLETVARVYLRVVSHREFFEDENGKQQPAIRWYLDLISAGTPDDDSPAWKHKVFRIESDQVRAELKLPLREGLRYSLEEIRPRINELVAKAMIGRQKMKAKKPLDLAESKMIELEERITMTLSLSRLHGLNQREEDTLWMLPPENGHSWKSLGDLHDKARQEADAGGAAAAYPILKDDRQRLFQLPPDVQRQLVRIVVQADLDQLPPAQQADALVDVVTALLTPPATLPPQQRRVWLKAAYVAIPATDAARIKAAVEADYQARLAASPAALGWDRMISAYRDRKPTEFNTAVAEYRDTHLTGVPASEKIRTRVEVTYNRFAPFYLCAGLYVFAFLLAVIGFIMYVAESPQWAVSLRRSASLVLIITLIVHTLALFARMHIMDRLGVFVTNLYSSAVFIGWGCVALCLILERIFPIGVGNTVAAVLGLSTTIVAHNLGTQDTLEMMEAVLDTNFWLATHVTTVTLGYTATFVAGFLGAIYVLMLLATVIRESYTSKGEPTVGALLAFGTAVLGLVVIPVFFLWDTKAALDKFEIVHPILLDAVFGLAAAAVVVYGLVLLLLRVSAAGLDAQGKPLQGQTPVLARPVVAFALTPESGKIIGQMIYGVVAFAMMLSFIGTVLGGIWADQSWGRFWGWDPKENGAVLIVLWNSLILHARWCGLVKERGTAVLAVFGNVMTAWSWFGTNQLGIGLHAYGFDSRLADGCFNFWVLQLTILGFGAAIPRHFWASAIRRAAPATPTTPTLPVAKIVPPPASAPPAAPTNTASPNGTGANGHVNGQANGNGHPRRDKGKRQGKRRT